MRCTHFALTLACTLLAACGTSPAGTSGSAGAGGNGSGGGAGAAADTPPTLTPDERAALLALSPAGGLPAPAPDASNRFADDPKAASFGQKLFFDPLFAGKLLDGDNDGSTSTLGKKGDTGKVSCAGCHVPSDGFVDNRTLGGEISLAAGWGRRKAPSLLDVGQAKLLMWDGRHDALYNQPFGPIESPVEMNSSRLYVAEQIFARHRAEYEALFGPLPALDDAQRFPALSADRTGCQPKSLDTLTTCVGSKHGMPGDAAEYDGLPVADQEAVTGVVVNVGKALGAYERLLSCGASRFDRWIYGETAALSNSEQRGAQLFVGAGKCVSCHSGPFLSDQKFHNVGLQPEIVAVVFIDDNDPGASSGLAAAIADPLNVRGKFSDGDDGRLPESVDVSATTGAFRTPALRCAAHRPSFMHTGHLKSLASVVSFFSRGGDLFGYPGKNELTPLSLTDQEQQDLAAFLAALDGPGPAMELLSPP